MSRSCAEVFARFLFCLVAASGVSFALNHRRGAYCTAVGGSAALRMRRTPCGCCAPAVPPAGGFPRSCGSGPRGMFVLFLRRQEKDPKEGEKRGTPPFPTPGSVEGLCPSSPAPETCILRHPSTRCRSRVGCRGPAGSTKRAWPGAIWEVSRRGRSLRQVPPLCGGCAPKGGLRAALPTSAPMGAQQAQRLTGSPPEPSAAGPVGRGTAVEGPSDPQLAATMPLLPAAQRFSFAPYSAR